jgi:hypothetical protein
MYARNVVVAEPAAARNSGSTRTMVPPRNVPTALPLAVVVDTVNVAGT